MYLAHNGTMSAVKGTDYATVDRDWEKLRRHHVFRTHPHGKELYRRFRHIIDDVPLSDQAPSLRALAEELGTSPQTLYNRRMREYRDRETLGKKRATAAAIKNLITGKTDRKKRKKKKTKKQKKKKSKPVPSANPVPPEIAEHLEEVLDATLSPEDEDDDRAIPDTVTEIQTAKNPHQLALSLQDLADIHQQTLIQIGQEMTEILHGFAPDIPPDGIRNSGTQPMRKRDVPAYMNLFIRLAGLQRQLIEDRVTMFGMIQSVDSVHTARAVESRLEQVIKDMSQHHPELLPDFVRLMEAGGYERK